MTWMSGIPPRLHGVAAVLLFLAVLAGDSRCTSLIGRKVTDDERLIKSCVGRLHPTRSRLLIFYHLDVLLAHTQCFKMLLIQVMRVQE
jgi:hypothetical protein